MLKTLAYFISILFHPILVPTYLFLIIAVYQPDLLYPLSYDYRYHFLLIIFTFTALIPGISVVILYFTGTIRSLKFYNRHERVYPLIMASVIYAGTSFLLSDKLSLNSTVIILLGCVTLSVLIITLITFFWKISAHSTGITALTIAVAGLIAKYDIMGLIQILYVLVIVCGLVMSSRLYLNAHTPMQTVAGMLVGLFSGILALSFI